MSRKFSFFIVLVMLFFVSVNADARRHNKIRSNDTRISQTSERSPFLDGEKLTIKELGAEHNDDYVILEGYIVKKVKGEKFLFRDSTGEILIEIDHDKKHLLKNVNEKTLVEIFGEYEKNYFEKDEIEVKNLKIIKQD